MICVSQRLWSCDTSSAQELVHFGALYRSVRALLARFLHGCSQCHSRGNARSQLPSVPSTDDRRESHNRNVRTASVAADRNQSNVQYPWRQLSNGAHAVIPLPTLSLSGTTALKGGNPMAKDGTNRGGRRVRAGAKPEKALNDKLAAGRPATWLTTPEFHVFVWMAAISGTARFSMVS